MPPAAQPPAGQSPAGQSPAGQSPAGLPGSAPGTLIEVRATPNASRDQVTRDGTRYLIRVTCAPEAGRANKAITKLLAKALGLPPSRLALVRGETSRDKTFRID